MTKTIKNGTAITFNRPSSQNHGLSGTVVAKRDKATSPIGVMLEGKTSIVWTDAKFLTINEQITDSVTVEGFNVGDSVTNIGRGSKSGMTGTVKKLRDAVTNVGVEYTEGVITWCKHTNLEVNGKPFAIGSEVEVVNSKSKKYGQIGEVKKYRTSDDRVGVNFSGDMITWCKVDNLALADDDYSDDYSDDWDSDHSDYSDDSFDSDDSIVINFRGVNITVSKDCDVTITDSGISVA